MRSMGYGLGAIITAILIAAACGTDGVNEASSADASVGTPTTDGGPGAEAGPGSDAGATGQCPDFTPYKRAYFGDLHTHTIFSADAWAMGTLNEPSDAYAFARGAGKTVAEGAKNVGPSTTIARPLDFDAVTDHSEWLAVTYGCVSSRDGKPLDPSSPLTGCIKFKALQGTGPGALAGANAVERTNCTPGGLEDDGQCKAVTESAWQIEQNAANNAYDACHFTTFVAYEWTAAGSGILHKNVIFANANVPPIPYDSRDYDVATKLWTALDQGCTSANGCTAITIPHNSNESNGEAFLVPQTAEGVRQMERYQRLVEIYQHKGSSECVAPDAGDPNADMACAFEQAGNGGQGAASFVRQGLKNGLSFYANPGDAGTTASNPLMLGIVGATDDHNGLPGNVDEGRPDGGPNGSAPHTWVGHGGSLDDTPKARLTLAPTYSPGAITGVWAEENTREAIFKALYNRETFATSGPRIQVRFFQTWDSTNYCGGGFPANIIDAHATPMGGSMPPTPPAGATGAPWLYVSTLQDEVPIARVDIIKAWVDAAGQHEQVIPFDATTNDMTCFRWQDSAYPVTAPVPTFYYARVLQQPTPRWSYYDCESEPGVAGCAAGGDLKVMVQERAWTSPIWALP
jgi:hypothetical protein